MKGPAPHIRAACGEDVGACVALLEAERGRRRFWQPIFWRPSPHAAEISRTYFTNLRQRPDTLFLVAEQAGEIVGFLIGRPAPAPPVYAPGGPTFLIDDFCVARPARWRDVGRSLLDNARTRICARGAAQIVIVCPDRDSDKKQMLRHAAFTLASTWWTAAA
ncbi:GNAT family N-acetyltransferase [Phenylobacterium aquaticum]|uniref:GNAT family N-acetyltransferase n=1 Tax=Phenylobacterium aquaticum TaxID=1763816 RepID=UPI0026F30811|nr:GNAT family N-acetyltransferase [Phenylobacterium aquaticum]